MKSKVVEHRRKAGTKEPNTECKELHNKTISKEARQLTKLYTYLITNFKSLNKYIIKYLTDLLFDYSNKIIT